MLVMSESRNSRVREHLSRQCEIDRPARLAHGDVESTIYDRVDGLPMAQLIIPFDEFAHHGALIVSLLAPVNVAVAGGYVTGFRDWRAAGNQQNGNIVACGVHQAAEGVCRAHGDMHHHDWGLAAGAIVTVRHRHGGVLMRDGDETRIPPIALA